MTIDQSDVFDDDDEFDYSQDYEREQNERMIYEQKCFYDPLYEIETTWPNVILPDKCYLPDKSGIYIVVNSQRRVLYVGKTKNLNQRWKNHHRFDEFLDLDKNSIIYWSSCDSWNLSNQEKYWIDILEPELNSESPQHKISFNYYDDPKLIAKLIGEKLNAEKKAVMIEQWVNSPSVVAELLKLKFSPDELRVIIILLEFHLESLKKTQ